MQLSNNAVKVTAFLAAALVKRTEQMTVTLIAVSPRPGTAPSLFTIKCLHQASHACHAVLPSLKGIYNSENEGYLLTDQHSPNKMACDQTSKDHEDKFEL